MPEDLSTSPSWSTRPMTWCRARSTSMWVQRNVFWQVLRDRNLHGFGMSHATTASPKPFFGASLRVDDAMVGRSAGWTQWEEWTSLPMPELLTMAFSRKDWKRIFSESSVKAPDDPVGQPELNWSDFSQNRRTLLNGYHTTPSFRHSTCQFGHHFFLSCSKVHETSMSKPFVFFFFFWGGVVVVVVLNRGDNLIDYFFKRLCLMFTCFLLYWCQNQFCRFCVTVVLNK